MVVNWVMSPPSAGSGGHTTIFSPYRAPRAVRETFVASTSYDITEAMPHITSSRVAEGISRVSPAR